ncbi:MAG TPA: hypothetical protein VFQ90_02085, partial [Stellaceae bacterium]|nr:hypothetical protein [Stellaceae bacterium]
MAFALGAGGNVRIQQFSWRGRGRAWLRLFLVPVGFFLAIGAAPIAASAAHLDAAPGGPIYEAIVVDAETGQVLRQLNPDAVTYPASLTKMMTLYLTFEAIN